MKPWELLDTTIVPGTNDELSLQRRDDEFSIRVGYRELMSSRLHGSEDALAELSCARLSCASPKLLIGGLGMGFTLAAALKYAGDKAKIDVAELVPAVVLWNRGPLGEHAGYPLKDVRVTVYEQDVAKIIKRHQKSYDAILLDVDNGPEGLTRKKNDWLYSFDGLNAAYAALRPKGVLAVWSAGPDQKFTQRLIKVGFKVNEQRVHAHGSKGARHIIWFATRSD